jgi:spermidine synthase
MSYYTYSPVIGLVESLALPVQLATLLFALVGFFPVSLLLSMITPIVITLSLTSLKKTGTTVGRIYAVSALASIAGTFMAGFLLIPLLGVKTIVLSVSAVLLLAGIFSSRGRVAGDLCVKAALVLLWLSFLTPRFCTAETAYYCINLEPTNSERGDGYRLVLDRLTHSYIFKDPTVLEYDYESVYGVVTEYLAERLVDRPLRTLNIGGGGYTMPKFIINGYPTAQVDVVEIDSAVTKFNESYLGLNPNGGIRTYNMDARVFFAWGADGNQYDLIFGDAFNDYSIPYHLTTLEFVNLVKEHLSPDGIYALNTIDDLERGRLLASFLRTVREVFPYVEVSTAGKDWRESGRNTFVVLASSEPIDRDRWLAAADYAYAHKISAPQSLTLAQVKDLLPTEVVTSITKRIGGVKLTDNYAPVDSMTAPLFREY